NRQGDRQRDRAAKTCHGVGQPGDEPWPSHRTKSSGQERHEHQRPQDIPHRWARTATAPTVAMTSKVLITAMPVRLRRISRRDVDRLSQYSRRGRKIRSISSGGRCTPRRAGTNPSSIPLPTRRIGAGTRARSARAVQSRIATPTGRRARDRAGRTSVDDTRVRFLEQSPQAAIPGPRPSRVALTELSTRGRYQSHRGGAGTGTRDPLDRGGAHPVLGPVGGIDPIVQGPIDVLEEHIGVDAARADVPREVVTGAPIPRGPGPVDGSDVELISLTHHPDDPGASQLPVISPGGDPQFRRVTDPVELVLGPPTHPCPPSIRDSTR